MLMVLNTLAVGEMTCGMVTVLSSSQMVASTRASSKMIRLRGMENWFGQVREIFIRAVSKMEKSTGKES